MTLSFLGLHGRLQCHSVLSKRILAQKMQEVIINMTITSFLKLVEIQTKVASMIPFFLGTVYTLYRFNSFNLKNFIIMFISLISVDMGTTAINNYMDYRKAIKKYGYNYEKHNAIVKYNLKESVVIATIVILFLLAVVFGFLLYINA